MFTRAMEDQNQHTAWDSKDNVRRLPVTRFPQLYAQTDPVVPLAPNRLPVQVVRVGRAVLNQKQNRSIGKAVSAAEGATAPNMSLCPVTYPAPSWRGLQAV